MPHMRAWCLRPSRGENYASRNQSIPIGPDILVARISLKWKIPIPVAILAKPCPVLRYGAGLHAVPRPLAHQIREQGIPARSMDSLGSAISGRMFR